MSEQKQSKRAYILTERSITVFHEGKPHTVKADDSIRYLRVKDAILSDDWDAVLKNLDVRGAIDDFTNGDISVIGGKVFYKNTEELHGVVVDKLLELLESGLKDATPIIKFITNLLANPSAESVKELYDFLQYKSLPIDEDGYVIGYKGVDGDYWSHTGNTETVVLKGAVDSQGRIYNGVGEEIEVERRCVDDRRQYGCSFGLHIGSYDFANNFRRGGRLMVVRFNPKDAVSVPTDSSCQKLRVCRYEVIDEVEVDSDGEGEEIRVPLYSTKEKKVANYHNVRDEFGRFTKKAQYHNKRDKLGRFTA